MQNVIKLNYFLPIPSKYRSPDSLREAAGLIEVTLWKTDLICSKKADSCSPTKYLHRNEPVFGLPT